MNEEIIKRHNELVSPDDTYYCLGDICMGTIYNSLPIINRLNGHKIIVLGNHDRCSPMYSHRTEEKRQHFLAEYYKYFEKIVDEVIIGIGDEATLLTHLPYWSEWFIDHAEHEKDFQPYMPRNKGLWHLCGHVHSKDRMLNEREIHVGVDAWNFYPVSEKQIINLMRSPYVASG